MIELYNDDCLEVMKEIPDSSIDMVLTDPPYYKVKGEAWDRQWDKPEQFLKWLGSCVEHWHRILKPNGSLYCFASPQMGAKVEILIEKRFNINNHIVWAKTTGRWKMASKEGLRRFFPSSERIIFAEHYGADRIFLNGVIPKDYTELTGFVFEPIRDYLDRLPCSYEQASSLLGWTGASVRHCFTGGDKFWRFPTREKYDVLQKTFPGVYQRNYKDLFMEKEMLKNNREDLRRPFNVTAKVPHTDVWTFEPVIPYKGKHPCEKPQDMLCHIINASTRGDAVILDCFMGTGSTGIACHDLNRDFIGIELDPGYFQVAKERIKDRQETFFAIAR